MRPNSSRPVIITVVVLLLGLGLYFGLKEGKKEPVSVPAPQVTFVREVIGSSVKGRAIESYTYGQGPVKLVFVGGIHGGYEWNSVMLAYQVLDYLKENTTLIPANISLTIIPSANPDGLYAVTGQEGRFMIAQVSEDEKIQATGRFNGNGVDLNRNFDCMWQPKSTWKSQTVSAGDEAFSEPEAKAVRDFMLKMKPAAVVFWHSQSNAVYASQCEKGILPNTLELMDTYAQASKYPAVKTFDAYATTGAADDWLASVNIPAITVELSSHEEVEFARNWAGVKALLGYYGTK